MRGFLLFPVLAAVLGAQTGGPLWWTSEPLRIVDIVTSLGRIDATPPAEPAAWKAQQGYNSEHLEIMGMHGGLDDQEFFFQSAVAGKVQRDYLREYVTEAHRRGIRVMVYFNVHWYTEAFGARHRDWQQIRENGQPVTAVYDNGTDMCLNSPWREWCFRVIRDLAAEGVDGIFYDGPIFRPDSCYCTHCKAKYRAQYSEEMPSKKTRQGPAAARLLDFQARSMAEFLRDSNRALKSANANAAFYMNGGVRGANWATARLNRVLVEHQDMLGSEGGFLSGDLTRVPLWKPGLTARMLETQAQGKPTVIFSAAAQKPWTFSLLPDPELRLLYADTIANGAGVWMGITTFDMKQPEMRAIEKMNRFVAAQKDYYTGSRSAARVALVWSDVTANFYAGTPAQMIDIDRIPQRSAVGNVDAEFNGLAEALLRVHVPFDVIDDVTLEREPLDRYRVIFLPNVACMSDTAAGRLRRYVEDGGNIFATFETALYDQTGVRRSDFVLAQVLGVNDGRKVVGPTSWDFMKPVAQHWLLDGIERELVPSTIYHARVTAKEAQTLMRFTVPLKGRYDGIPEVSADPALTVRQVGKGTAIYFAGDFGNTVEGFHLPELMRLAANASDRLAPPPFRIDNAPASVEVVWRTQPEKKRKILHLVNFTGAMSRPITQIVPLHDVRITLANEEQPRKARTLVSGKELQIWHNKSARVEVRIPSVAEYEAVVFEE
jgi:hypothetical protein